MLIKKMTYHNCNNIPVTIVNMEIKIGSNFVKEALKYKSSDEYKIVKVNLIPCSRFEMGHLNETQQKKTSELNYTRV